MRKVKCEGPVVIPYPCRAEGWIDRCDGPFSFSSRLCPPGSSPRVHAAAAARVEGSDRTAKRTLVAMATPFPANIDSRPRRAMGPAHARPPPPALSRPRPPFGKLFE
ncbi:unnamed protein product [Plutella xylostella]|uniref:(diamondback moth) hypothetical protein n=1 Tax=Plutella xylostella TaxID=51655 RepID=A0A8S4E534_PLUXY|nr:unnamed protein product [Plutella xylostella]